MPKKTLDLSGQRFGYLTALYPTKRNGKIYYMCRCVCGKEKEIYGYSLRKVKLSLADARKDS